MTLKMESRSYKYNQLFRLSWSLNAGLVGIKPKVWDISNLVKLFLFQSSSDLENEVKVTKI